MASSGLYHGRNEGKWVFGVPEAFQLVRGESFELLDFKGLYRNGVWGGFDV